MQKIQATCKYSRKLGYTDTIILKKMCDQYAKGQWMYLYHAVDSEGNTIDFYLSKSRNHKTVKRFFKKTLRSFHISKPHTITVDKNLAYPITVIRLKNVSNHHQLL